MILEVIQIATEAFEDAFEPMPKDEQRGIIDNNTFSREIVDEVVDELETWIPHDIKCVGTTSQMGSFGQKLLSFKLAMRLPDTESAIEQDITVVLRNVLEIVGDKHDKQFRFYNTTYGTQQHDSDWWAYRIGLTHADF